MHWADKIAQDIIASNKYKPYWVDDMKTPSGFAHIGSMMGPVIHSAVYRALKDEGMDGTFTFVINDFDHADNMSEDLKKIGYEKYMGMSLKMIPSPDPNYKSMADFFAADFISSIRSLGVEARTVSSWELYHQGKFDDVIKLALDNAEKIQNIYKNISGSDKKQSGWLPFQVICEKCQKLGTTRVFSWDGKDVSYKCEPDMVSWAKGCGHEGKISPFGGNGKLPWKVDWPAHWKVIGITIEGAGKDHASAGGSYDIAMEICKEIFGYNKPYRMPYEFILIGGKKMSSSKGIGLKAHDLVNILPPEVARFLFVSADIKSQSNFDPDGTMAIPDLFDKYDECWTAYDKSGDKKLARTYVLSQITSVPEKDLPAGRHGKGLFIPRFRDVANYLSQGVNHEELIEKMTQIKNGKVDDSEMKVLEKREKYAKIWLENYAPEEYKFEMTNDVPETAKTLSKEQKEYLKTIMTKFESLGKDATEIQFNLFEISKSIGIKGKDAFAAIYTALIGKTHGPKAGVLILNIGKDNVIKRLKEVTS